MLWNKWSECWKLVPNWLESILFYRRRAEEKNLIIHQIAFDAPLFLWFFGFCFVWTDMKRKMSFLEMVGNLYFRILCMVPPQCKLRIAFTSICFVGYFGLQFHFVLTNSICSKWYNRCVCAWAFYSLIYSSASAAFACVWKRVRLLTQWQNKHNCS